jgi:hypothetical protein
MGFNSVFKGLKENRIIGDISFEIPAHSLK